MALIKQKIKKISFFTEWKNIALRKPTFGYGYPYTGSNLYGSAGRAVDGIYFNDRETVAIPIRLGNDFPYLGVDLIQKYNIFGVNVMSRFDC